MNPKLKSTSVNPAAVRDFGATVKATLHHDLVIVGQLSGREVRRGRSRVEMLEAVYDEWARLPAVAPCSSSH